MSKNTLPILYIKSSCPWCQEALSFFNAQGVELDVRDVNQNPKDMDAMVALSGQTKTPTFEYEDMIVADFDVDEFLAELNEFPEIRRKLGICDDEN
jgi:glutaredoxin 3